MPEGTAAPAPRWARLVVIGLAALFVAAGLRQAATDSPTVDEGVDLAGGLSHLVHRDLRMSPEHPVLPKVLAALPALAADPIVPRDRAWREGAWFDHTDSTLAANDRAGRLRRVLFLSRLVPLAEAVACGVLIFLLARRLAGEASGLLAAGLWFTTPIVLGLGHVQSIDMAFTLATLAVSLALLRHREAPSLRRAAAVGATLALALATRHTALVLVPVVLGAVAVSCPGDRAVRLRQVGLTALVGWAGLWLVYRGFDLTSPGGAAGERFDALVVAGGDRSALARLALLVPAPQEWRAGLGHLAVTSDPRPAWLFGRAWEGSRWWFFPGSLVATVPAAVLALLVVGSLGWIGSARDQRRAAALLLALPGLALLAFTVVQPLNLGLRLALPSLALWLVVASGGAGHAAAAVGSRWPRAVVAGRLALVLVAIVQAAVLVTASSHALAWRPLAFRPGYRWVSDSNLDFGQDLWRVRDWAEGRDAWVAVISPRGLAPEAGTRRLVGTDPDEVTGWVVVGATALTVVHRDDLSWLRAYCPVGTLGGGSTLLYRFRGPPSAEPGPDRPVAPCEGAAFSSRR